eukprot:g28082.t1
MGTWLRKFQLSSKDDLGLPACVAEVAASVRHMKNGKVAGVDGIPAEIYKLGGAELTHHLHQLFLKIWDKEEIAADLRGTVIATVFKNGDKLDYRVKHKCVIALTLFSIFITIILRVVDNKLPS